MFDTSAMNDIIIVGYCLAMSAIFIIGFFILIKSNKHMVKTVASPEDTIRWQRRISKLQAEKMKSKSIVHTEPPSSIQIPFDSIKEQEDNEELQLLKICMKDEDITSKKDTSINVGNVDLQTSICEDVNIKGETPLSVLEESVYEFIEQPTSKEIKISGEDEGNEEESEYEILEYEFFEGEEGEYDEID
ncbi:uncharacterized protein LOC111613145 [Centruroides sculpturatus]|uniref:uncharacterized protein LOC111613145 n=1 Tax=Centruroides sculpturatus TaxID=218467 RepID=UPI000C6E8052|nr:uncharacterized protein LOC111613145 [Centruroides sculpturatus]